MSTTQVIDQTKIICGLKAAVTALECLHDAQKKEQKEQKKRTKCKIKPTYIYTHVIVPDKSCAEKKKLRSKSSRDIATTAALKDAHRPLAEVKCKDKKRIDKPEKASPRLIFPEMRAGILYSRCYCLHRNGLQDDCPLSQCQGQSECLIKPWPICPPAKFVRQRHPELYPKTSNIDCVT